MITFMQRVLQRHYKWLFSILLVIIIIAFVFTIGASPGIGTGKSAEKKMFYGYNLNDERDMRELFQGAALDAFLKTGSFPQDRTQLESNVLARAALLHLADSLQIPEPTEASLIQFIQTRPAFQNTEGRFDAARYDDFKNMVQHGMKSENARVFMAQDLRIDATVSAIADPGYITSFETRQQAQIIATQWSLLVAEQSYDSFKPEIDLSEAAIKAYYDAHAMQYLRAPEVMATYVLIPTEAFLNDLSEPSEASLRTFWEANPNLFEAQKSFEAAQATVLSAYQREAAKKLAAEKAMEVAYTLYNQNISYGTDAFKAVLKDEGLALKSLPNFSKDSLRVASTEAGLPYAFLGQAFKLSESQYFSEPHPTSEGFAILFYEGTQPERVPAFDEVEAEVAVDYKYEAARKQFAEQSAQLEEKMKTALASGESFEAAAEAAGLRVRSYEDFTLKALPQGLDYNLVTATQGLTTGEMSTSVMTPSGSAFVYLKNKEVPEVSEASPEWQEAEGQLRYLTSQANLQNFLEEMIEKELR